MLCMPCQHRSRVSYGKNIAIVWSEFEWAGPNISCHRLFLRIRANQIDQTIYFWWNNCQGNGSLTPMFFLQFSTFPFLQIKHWGRHKVEDTLNENCCTLIKMSLRFIPKDPRIQVTILKHLRTQCLGAAGQATSHCPDFWRIYASLSRNELRLLNVYHIESK